MAVSIQISLTGDVELRNTIQRIAQAAGDRTQLHARFGIQILNWIDRNFQQEGALTGRPWAKLSPNTIAGRRRGSSRILQDTGGLKSSFTERHDASGVRVGSAKEISEYHQLGTRPYVIRPKNAKALAFTMAGGGRAVGASFSSINTKRTFRKGQKLTFAKFVNHPGLVARPMLPTAEQITPILITTARNYLNEIIGKR